MKHLIDDKIITSNSEPRVVDTLIESVISDADKHFFSTLKSLDIEVE